MLADFFINAKNKSSALVRCSMGSVAEIVDAKEVIFSNTTKISDSFFHIFVILKLTVAGATRRLHHCCHRFHDESQTVKSRLQECKQMIEILCRKGLF